MAAGAVGIGDEPRGSVGMSSTADGLFTYAVCITAPETHWKCNDSARILLTSEDGVRHCILFPPQQVETGWDAGAEVSA